MRSGTQTILIVDDEAEDLATMSAALRALGFRVFESSNYDDAMGTFDLHRGEIDLLLSDISLPGNNGCELARALLKVKPDLKVLFVSGYAGAEVVRFYGLSIADAHFLRKPFTATALVARARDVLSAAPIALAEATPPLAQVNTAQ